MDEQAVARKLLQTMMTQLQTKLDKGEATAADFNVIRQFLKDNGIELARVPGGALDKLADTAASKLPFFTDPNGVNYHN